MVEDILLFLAGSVAGWLGRGEWFRPSPPTPTPKFPPAIPVHNCILLDRSGSPFSYMKRDDFPGRIVKGQGKLPAKVFEKVGEAGGVFTYQEIA